MIRRVLTPLALSLLALGSGLQVQAADQDSQRSQIIDLFNQTFAGSLPASTMLILAFPGVPISAEQVSKDNPDGLEELSKWLDTIPQAADYYFLTNNSYSGLYNDIVSKVVTPPPDPKLAARTAAASSALRKAKPAFRDLYDAYMDAKSDYLLKQKAGDPGADIAKRKMNEANDDMTQDDSYTPYIEAATKLNRLHADNPAIFWFNAQDDFSNAVQGDYYPLLFMPQPSSWLDDNGWTRKTFKVEKHSSSHSSSAMSWNASLKANVGKLNADINASGSNASLEDALANSDVSWDFEYKRVIFIRPWWNAEIETRSEWEMPNKDVYSYGSFALNSKLGARIPVYTTGLYLIRNLNLTIEDDADTKKAVQKALDIDGTVSYGPVTIKGGYSKHSDSATASSSLSQTTITVTGVQVAAFIGNCEPKFPIKTVKALGY